MNPRAAAEARYRAGELHRLRGEFDAADEAYREASVEGVQVQPGLALLRLAQGRGDVAVASLRRALGETADPLARVRLLPAQVEVSLAADQLDQAREACIELDRIAAVFDSPVVRALVAGARGALALAEDDPSGGLVALRQAESVWREHQAPYEAARVRVLVSPRVPRARRRRVGGARARRGARRRWRSSALRPRWPLSMPWPHRSPPRMGCRRASCRCCVWSQGCDQQGDRRRARPERAHRRPPREQHLHEAEGAVAGGSHRLRVRARAALTG